MYRKSDRRVEDRKGKSVEPCVVDRLNIYPHALPVRRVVTLQFSKRHDVTKPALYATRFICCLSFLLSLKIGRVLRAHGGKSRLQRSKYRGRRQLVKASKTSRTPQSIRPWFLRKIEYNGLVNYLQSTMSPSQMTLNYAFPFVHTYSDYLHAKNRQSEIQMESDTDE